MLIKSRIQYSSMAKRRKKVMNPKAVLASLRSPKTPLPLKRGLANKYPKLARQAGLIPTKRYPTVHKSLKRRKTRSYSMARKKNKSRRKSGLNLGPMAGIAVYAFLEGTIDVAVSRFGLPIDMAQLALGYYLMKKKRGIVGGIGKTMFTLNLYTLVKREVGGGVIPLLQGQPTSVSDGGW